MYVCVCAIRSDRKKGQGHQLKKMNDTTSQSSLSKHWKQNQIIFFKIAKEELVNKEKKKINNNPILDCVFVVIQITRDKIYTQTHTHTHNVN